MMSGVIQLLNFFRENSTFFSSAIKKQVSLFHNFLITINLTSIQSTYHALLSGFEKQAKGIATGPKIAPITPQNTALAPLLLAIK